jgi:hypothetical protein
MDIFTLGIIAFIIELLLVSRYASFATTQWYLFSIRDSICIKKFSDIQKVGDSIMASYNTVATIAHLWLTVMILSYLIGFNISVLIMVEITSIIVLLLILQIIFRYIIDKKYRLKQCYNFLVKFKENEDVVGEENDYEVRFIQTYNAIRSEKGWNVVWIIYIVLMAIFLIHI